jgi:DNA polymerase-3 subunit gamma/tau
VRELTESLRYGPARDRYKVVVIDEIHRLSRQAFDALLKIIEEPPPHLVFIFATTEIDTVPATILSRCQEFHFRRVPADTVSDLLRSIAQEESIEASDAALRLIARAGEGSVRDSLALLDQLATFGSGAIPDDEALRLLGGMDTALFEEVLTGILSGDRASISAAVRRVEDEGWDPRNVYAQFLSYCRDGLHLSLAPSADGDRLPAVDLPAEEAGRLAEHARAAGYENLLRLLRQLLSSEQTVRRSDASALALEIAWLRAAELPRLTRIEDLLAGTAQPSGDPGAARSAGPRSPRPSPPPPSRPPAQDAGFAADAAEPAPKPQPAPAPDAQPGSGPSSSPDPEPRAAAAAAPTVEGFLERLTDLKGALAGHLRQAESLRFDDGVLHVTVAPDDEILADRLQRPNNRELLDRAVRESFGPDARWRSERGSGTAAPPTPAERPATEPAPDAQVQDNPTVQTVLEIFDGTVEGVEDENEES